MWFLSPSGWPTAAIDGSLFARSLTARGWLVIDESQVQAAVDAYNAAVPPAPPGPDFFDSEVAARVAGPGLTADALSAAFGAPKAGSTFVLLGNSRMAAETYGGAANYQGGAFTWANAQLRHRAKVVNYAGVTSDTLPDMIARFAAAVAAHDPDNVLIMDAVNDVSNGRTLAQIQADYTTLIGLCRNIGARPVLLTLAPNQGHDTGQQGTVAALNRWLKTLTDPAVLVIDVAAAVAAVALTQQWRTGHTLDGLHQSRAGAQAMGAVIAAALDPLLPGPDPLPATPGDPGCLVPNPLGYTTAGPGADRLPDWWAPYPAIGTAGFAYSVLARIDGRPGHWAQITTTSVAGGQAAYIAPDQIAIAGLAAVGDRLVGMVEFESDPGWTNKGDVDIGLQALDAGGAVLASAKGFEFWTGQPVTPRPVKEPALATEGDPWVLQTEPLVLPAGTVAVKFVFEFAGIGTVRMARPAAYKL